MNQDIFKSAVHRSLSKSLKSKEREINPNNESEFGSIIPNKDNKNPFSLSLEALTHEKTREKREKDNKEKVKPMALVNFDKNNFANFDGFAKNFAETLLKGAIDLQESLNMLESFQKNVNKKKRKPKNRGENEIQEVLNEGYNSKKFISNGSSKNNLEGIKKVIKESFLKQNLIIDSLDDQSSCSSRAFKGISYNNNCNNYNNVYNNNNSNNYNNVNNNDNDEKNNSRGVVAKLMGLGEVPIDLENYDKRDLNSKSLSSPRAFLDLEKMPRVKKENCVNEKNKIDLNQKALQEIMETMQFKGLMRNNQAEKEDLDAILVKNRDQSANFVSKEKKPENGNMVKKGIEIKQVKSKIEASKNMKNNNRVKKPSVERKPESSIKKKIEEKKGLNVNFPALKTVQRSERNTIGTSNGVASSRVANHVASNSNASMKEKNTMVIKKTESLNTIVVNKRIKREVKEIRPKKQKINGVKNDSSILPNKSININKKKPEIIPSIEGDDWSVSFEASPLKEEKELINFSPKKKINIKLLLLGDKSFIKLANELGLGKIEDLKLFLDIAEEQILRKNLNFDLFYAPFQIQGIKHFYCVENSIGDIIVGIKKLNGYVDLKKNEKLKDNLYLKLEKDLSCKNEGINSIWDLGWIDWVCLEEVSGLVCDFSDYILSLLIEEVSLDLFM